MTTPSTVLGAAVVTAASVLAALGSAGPNAQVAPAAATPRDESMARHVCAACHAFPAPDVLPRGLWAGVVAEMTGLAFAGIGAPPSGPEPPLDFDPAVIRRYYETRAPVTLGSPAPWPAPGQDPQRFVRRAFTAAVPSGTPLVANVEAVDLDGKGRTQIVASDMAAGLVLAADPLRPDSDMRVLGRVPHPCHTAAVDLDRDGLPDLVVADLGGVTPGDYLKGSVVWLRRLPEGGYHALPLATGLPRVADVQPADADGDGDWDLIVAAFGWREVGGIYLLENRTRDPKAPLFVHRQLDPRPGAIHVPVTDLNGDGRPDFVALLAQHYEAVVAFLNDGKGAFRPHTLHEGPHPSWGYSGLALVDFDRDRDIDLLLTNGDMLDDFLLKPYHGIRWLENRGKLSFVEHELANLPGVHRALAADVDADGDLDVVACAYVRFKTPQGEVIDPGAQRRIDQMPSLVWLEQLAPGRFERHTLELGAQHVTLDVADYDRDGDPDLFVGHFWTRGRPLVEVWENTSRRK